LNFIINHRNSCKDKAIISIFGKIAEEPNLFWPSSAWQLKQAAANIGLKESVLLVRLSG